MPKGKKSLRGDWPGKKEAIARFVSEWNRYPLKTIREGPTGMAFGIRHFPAVAFEGAPEDSYQITIKPGHDAKGRRDDIHFLAACRRGGQKSHDPKKPNAAPTSKAP